MGAWRPKRVEWRGREWMSAYCCIELDLYWHWSLRPFATDYTHIHEYNVDCFYKRPCSYWTEWQDSSWLESNRVWNLSASISHPHPLQFAHTISVHFTPSTAILLLYPRENGEFGGTGREWRYHSDVSVRLPRNTESILLLLAWDAASSTTVMLLHASLVYRSCCSRIFTYAYASHGTHSVRQPDWWKPSSKKHILLWNLLLVYLMSLIAEIILSDRMNR